MPYLELEGQKIFDEFKLDEPWDSEHNIRLLERMPKTYEAPWKKYVDVPPHHTVLHVFVGEGATFEWRRGLKLKEDFLDGMSNTLLYVEAGPPVPWTKPEEIEFTTISSIRLRGLFRDGMRAGTVDGSGYKMIPHDYDEQRLRSSVTRNGGEESEPAWYR